MIPLSRDEIEHFTPDSLANVAPKPTIRMRPASPRDERTIASACRIEGLTHHNAEAIRAEQLRALRAMWSPEIFETESARLRGAWDSLDQGVAIPDDEAQALSELSLELHRHWRPLRQMHDDNEVFERDFPRLALCIFIAGWSNIDVPYKRVSGQVPLETIDLLLREVEAIEARAIADKIDGASPGVAVPQVNIKALQHVALTQGERGNSSSPSPSPSTPSGSMTDGPTAVQAKPIHGSSPTSNTVKTRRTRSTKPTST